MLGGLVALEEVAEGLLIEDDVGPHRGGREGHRMVLVHRMGGGEVVFGSNLVEDSLKRCVIALIIINNNLYFIKK